MKILIILSYFNLKKFEIHEKIGGLHILPKNTKKLKSQI